MSQQYRCKCHFVNGAPIVFSWQFWLIARLHIFQGKHVANLPSFGILCELENVTKRQRC